MKALKTSLSLMALVALAGCATRPRIVVNQPVGPGAPHVSRRKGQGELVVYSALEVADPDDYYHPTHSGYTIFNGGGQVFREVDNRAGSFYQEPVTVSLPAGNYKVRARATNSGTVIVPVVIEDGQTTVVDLEGATLPQTRKRPGDQFVRLPDGQIIGTRAE